MGNKKIALLVAAALVAGPLVANADSVTYDFTGTVNSASGNFSSAGSSVAGTITINFSAGNPTQSGGTIGSTTSQWVVDTIGGAAYGLATPSSQVFTSTLNSGFVTYGPVSPSSLGSQSSVGSANGGSSYVADELEYSLYGSNNEYTENYIQLNGGTGASAPFNSAGLPILGNATSQSDQLLETLNGHTVGSLNYTITSLTPVPLPAAAWLLVGGLGGLGAFARKTRTNATA